MHESAGILWWWRIPLRTPSKNQARWVCYCVDSSKLNTSDLGKLETFHWQGKLHDSHCLDWCKCLPYSNSFLYMIPTYGGVSWALPLLSFTCESQILVYLFLHKEANSIAFAINGLSGPSPPKLCRPHWNRLPVDIEYKNNSNEDFLPLPATRAKLRQNVLDCLINVPRRLQWWLHSEEHHWSKDHMAKRDEEILERDP
jgi:hypothetical protein